jgi:two-component system phosphate regulon sensor histidine kinase PhoR
MTERLAESRQRLDEAEQQRRRFLADVTHELSTPLTSIRGYAETLLDPHVPVTAEERAAYLGHVLEESRRMDALLHDLLDLARLEAGVGETVRERIDLVALVRHATQRHAPRFAQAGLALHWKPESVASAGVDADGRRLEQVVDNLLANALRYVPRTGSVWVGVDVCDGAAEGPTGPPEVRLVVEDDGPGFPPGSLDSVFDRFYRADPSRPSGGTGLGLAIVKEIVLRHGGTVRASGRDEGGARIEVRLPSEGA